MSLQNLTPLLGRTDVLLTGLALSVLILLWIARRVHRIAKSDRPDEALSNVAMVIGLGWSSEAVWELTGQAGFPTSLRLLLFFVLETLLVLSMIRAKRTMRDLGHPGRSGRTAWIVASGMALVGSAVAGSFGEAVLRLLIPLLITLAWWDGLIGETAKRREDATTVRWTLRRFWLWVGAIEPGERDVETVNRERVTQLMTRLEYRRRHGWVRLSGRRAERLARLSLTADDDMIAEVRRRVDRATWFEPTQQGGFAAASQRLITAGAAASARTRRVRHGKAVRRVHVAHPRPVVVAAQESVPDPRLTQEIDYAICVMKAGDPELSYRRIAHLLGTSDAKVGRALRRTQNPSPPPPANGQVPELEGAKS